MSGAFRKQPREPDGPSRHGACKRRKARAGPPRRLRRALDGLRTSGCAFWWLSAELEPHARPRPALVDSRATAWSVFLRCRSHERSPRRRQASIHHFSRDAQANLLDLQRPVCKWLRSACSDASVAPLKTSAMRSIRVQRGGTRATSCKPSAGAAPSNYALNLTGRPVTSLAAVAPPHISSNGGEQGARPSLPAG